MAIIDNLINIKDDQYWKAQGDQIICVPKPQKICYIQQVWDFAKVMYVVKTHFNDETQIDRVKVNPAIINLLRRYVNLTQDESLLGFTVKLLFLTILGYVGENDFDQMMLDLTEKRSRLGMKFNWTNHCRNVSTTSEEKVEELKRKYENQGFPTLISRIDAAHKENKNVCLFLGKKPNDPLPSTGDEVWVSGSQEISDAIPENRLHLWLDFNGKLPEEPLFNTIVVDYDMFAELNSDFAKRLSVMLKDENSQIIIQPQLKVEVADGIENPIVDSKTYTIKIRSYREVDYTEKKKLFQDYLNTLFETVEFNSDSFSYASTDILSKVSYFVVKKPRTGT